MLAILGLFGVLMAGLAADAVISSSGDEADDSEDSPPEDAGAISDGDLLDDLAGDPRFADFAGRADSADALISQLREVFLTQPTDVWLPRLHAADLIAE